MSSPITATPQRRVSDHGAAGLLRCVRALVHGSCALALVTTCASAEEGQPGLVLDTIEVTGQKLTRELQQTLDSVSVLTGEELERSGVSDLRDAFRLAPNILYTPSNNGNNGISIRGINSEGVGGGGGNSQPLASMVVDGAPQSQEGMRKGARGVWDVEAVEILRGPQISQGRNALAGAVIVKTRDPSALLESSVRATSSNQGRAGAVMFNTPLSEQLYFRFAAERIDKEKGIDYSDSRVDFLDDEDFYSIRSKLLFEPYALPDFTAKLTLARAHDDPAITAVSEPFFDRKLTTVFAGIEQRVNDVDNVVLDLNYVLKPGFEVKSLSTLTRTDTDFETPSPEFNRDETREDRDFTQELRTSFESDDGRLSLVVGGFFGRFKNNRDSFVERLVPETTTETRAVEVTANGCVDIDFAADGDGRWYEHASDAFAQIDQGANGTTPDRDGFFITSQRPALNPIGAGADVFPFEGDWDNPGSLLLDVTTLNGAGTEVVPVTSGSFDFNSFIADDDALGNLAYTTTVPASTGNVTYVDGSPTGVDTTLDVAFTYDTTGTFDIGLLTETGSLTLRPDNTFTLQAGDPNIDTLDPAAALGRYAWEFDGTYNIDAVQTCVPPGTATANVTTTVPTGNLLWATVQNLESETTRRNYAMFGEFDWRLTDRLRLNAGLRYDTETSTYSETSRDTDERVKDDTSYDALLPKFGLAYDVAPGHTVGFVVSRGYRGGFVDRGAESSPVLTAVDPEYLWAYELSLRSLTWGGKLRTNANVFYYDWTDQQITVQLVNAAPPQSVVRNAGRSRSYGAELSVNARPTPEWNISASLGLLRTEFVDFETDLGDFSGNEFPEAPEVSGSISIDHSFPRGWFVGGDFNYQSGFFATADLENNPDLRVPGRSLLNLRAGYVDPAGRWQVFASAANALDKDYLVGRDSNGGAYVGDERELSLTVQLNF